MKTKAKDQNDLHPIHIILLLLLLSLYSCTMHKMKEPSRQPGQREAKKEKKTTLEKAQKAGIFHIVQRGENLYRISKTYGVELTKLARWNGIKDPSKIYVGQAIYIPGARKPLPILRKEEKGHSSDLSFLWPVSGDISSYFGDKRSHHYHSGIDIRSPYGNPIMASRSGVVIFNGYQRGYGRTVIIDHQDGFSTLYAHNCENLVTEGERVSRGEIIARVGTTGNASGSHIHFEIRINGTAVDPLLYLDDAKDRN